ncbi:hypothetical protein F8388_012080 [Cannabis sativa]|uniref:Uncharacterized protein n=1 Tax=Cannabis sativa TaxID=3483 RepID=A0A7J6GEA1_CANSA|nr:hypothetical protein F8388_012080 [Cannabis sativa]
MSHSQPKSNSPESKVNNFDNNCKKIVRVKRDDSISKYYQLDPRKAWIWYQRGLALQLLATQPSFQFFGHYCSTYSFSSVEDDLNMREGFKPDINGKRILSSYDL